jgi:hypothetical protein
VHFCAILATNIYIGAAERAGLKISAKLLRLAQVIR